MPRLINCIVAVCPNMGIGKDGNFPWHPIRLSKELKHFQKMTTTPSVEGKRNAVIMGRKTWFSIPEKHRPLKDRINIVLSRELKELPQGANYLAHDLDSALTHLDSSELQDKVDLVWIIGGSTLYKEMKSMWEHPRGETSQCRLEVMGCCFFFSFHTCILIQMQLESLNVPPNPEAMESPVSHRIFVTRILKDFESDTFIQEMDLNKFKLLPKFPDVPTEVQEDNGIQYKFEVYERITHA